ncbi:mannose-1-phosphate guanylyltransferase [Paenibacillus sp. HJGM_3]|uniref:mannose-1-phosphate guanylyltransferase n=1 Tax=Paenibacillus sp. HJGM_3 TaxID=3379816 RepID=UPI00385C8253
MKILIMAGGKGTRFWPRSVSGKPKQFLALTGTETMIQLTYRRFLKWLPQTSVYVVAPVSYLDMIAEQLPELNREQIIVEPEQRDTGPCIALAAMHFLSGGQDEVLVTTPSDQYIPEDGPLLEALKLAEETANAGRNIVTLGIVPTRPETGYGYIEAEEEGREARPVKVRSFVEKPTLDKAEKLFTQSNMYWNSGIFIWKPSTIAHYMQLHQPRLWELLNRDPAHPELVYGKVPKLSVDYAILEKAEAIYTIPVSFPWDDVGTWTSLERIFPPDSEGNVSMGHVHTLATSNSILFSEHLQSVVIGVRDLIVVSTEAGLLICHKSMEQQIKDVIHALEHKEE